MNKNREKCPHKVGDTIMVMYWDYLTFSRDISLVTITRIKRIHNKRNDDVIYAYKFNDNNYWELLERIPMTIPINSNTKAIKLWKMADAKTYIYKPKLIRKSTLR